MFLFSKQFLTVFFNHFELENGKMTTPKHRLNFIMFFTCLCMHNQTFAYKNLMSICYNSESPFKMYIHTYIHIFIYMNYIYS